MIIEVKGGEEYWPRYKGMWVTNTFSIAEQWEKAEVIPAGSGKLVEGNMGPETNRCTVPSGAKYYVWARSFLPTENEFGPECP